MLFPCTERSFYVNEITNSRNQGSFIVNVALINSGTLTSIIFHYTAINLVQYFLID
jgi:hypothetical protein